jgi:DNA-binding NarL/FixJ family response regulator
VAFLLVGHPSMLMGIHNLLATESNTVLIAIDEVSLLKAVQKVTPDLVIADLSFPVPGRTNVVKFINQCNPAIKIIILSTYDHSPAVDEIIKDGADGFVLRQRAVLNNIVLGETTLDKEIQSGKVTVQGKKESLSELVALLDKFDFWFNIVTP